MPSRKIAEVITGQTLIAATPDTTVREAARLMSSAHVGAIMVVDNDRLIGIFTERDALKRVLATDRVPQDTRLAEVMTPDPVTATPQQPLGHALHMMFEGGYRHVPVVVDGHPVGMISARDALPVEQVAFEDELERREEIGRIL